MSVSAVSSGRRSERDSTRSRMAVVTVSRYSAVPVSGNVTLTGSDTGPNPPLPDGNCGVAGMTVPLPLKVDSSR
jgi:hypothetical protein